MHFYNAVVRLILEYACPAWHPCLIAAQIDTLKLVQRRILRIKSYTQTATAAAIRSLAIAGTDTLKDREEVLIKTLFKRHVLPSSSSSDPMALYKCSYYYFFDPDTQFPRKKKLCYAKKKCQAGMVITPPVIIIIITGSPT